MEKGRKTMTVLIETENGVRRMSVFADEMIMTTEGVVRFYGKGCEDVVLVPISRMIFAASGNYCTDPRIEPFRSDEEMERRIVGAERTARWAAGIASTLRNFALGAVAAYVMWVVWDWFMK